MFSYVHLIIRVIASSKLHNHLNPVNHDVYDYSDLPIARLNVLDLAIARLGEMD